MSAWFIERFSLLFAAWILYWSEQKQKDHWTFFTMLRKYCDFLSFSLKQKFISDRKINRSVHGDEILFQLKAQEIAIFRDVIKKIVHSCFLKRKLQFLRSVIYRTKNQEIVPMRAFYSSSDQLKSP